MFNTAVHGTSSRNDKKYRDNLSLLYCIPFAGILLCIAICPLVAGEWWEKRKPIVVAFWSLAFLIPFAIAVGMGTAWEELLEAIIGDYLTFIVLLFGLFCVAGNISLEGDLVGKPEVKCFAFDNQYIIVKLDRYDRSKYVDDPSDDPCEQMA